MLCSTILDDRQTQSALASAWGEVTSNLGQWEYYEVRGDIFYYVSLHCNINFASNNISLAPEYFFLPQAAADKPRPAAALAI